MMMARGFWGDMKAEPTSSLISLVAGKHSTKKTLLSPEWPDAGHEAAEATWAGQ